MFENVSIRTLVGQGGLARLVAGVGMATIAGRLMQLALAYVLVRRIGSSGYGLFAYVVGMNLVIRNFLGMGCPESTTRFLPAFASLGHHGQARGFKRFAIAMIAITTLVAVTALSVTLHFAPEVFSTPQGVLYLALLLVPNGLLIQHVRILTAQGRPAAANVLELILPSALTMVALLFLSRAQVTPARIMVLFIAATTIAMVLAIWLARKNRPNGERNEDAVYEVKSWLTVSIPIMISIGFRDVINRVDVILLAPLAGLSQVGIYSLAVQLSYTLTFPQMVVNSVMAPIYARKFAERNVSGLRRAIGASLGFAVLTSLPIAAVFMFYSRELMVIAGGAPFAPAAPVLWYLTLSQFLAAILTPLSAFLMSCNGERRLLTGTVAALIVNLAANSVAIPMAGAEGAAVARVLTIGLMTGWALVGVSQILRYMRASTEAHEPDPFDQP